MPLNHTSLCCTARPGSDPELPAGPILLILDVLLAARGHAAQVTTTSPFAAHMSGCFLLYPHMQHPWHTRCPAPRQSSGVLYFAMSLSALSLVFFSLLCPVQLHTCPCPSGTSLQRGRPTHDSWCDGCQVEQMIFPGAHSHSENPQKHRMGCEACAGPVLHHIPSQCCSTCVLVTVSVYQ